MLVYQRVTIRLFMIAINGDMVTIQNVQKVSYWHLHMAKLLYVEVAHLTY